MSTSDTLKEHIIDNADTCVCACVCVYSSKYIYLNTFMNRTPALHIGGKNLAGTLAKANAEPIRLAEPTQDHFVTVFQKFANLWGRYYDRCYALVHNVQTRACVPKN